MGHRQPYDLTVSLRAVTNARSSLDLARAQRALPGVATSEQRHLLRALEDYADALTSHGHPMPYRMHSELAMYRAMFNPSRPSVRD